MRPLIRAVVLLSIVSGTCLADSLPGVLPVVLPESDFLYLRMERERALSLEQADFQLGGYQFTLFPFFPESFRPIAHVNNMTLAVFGSLREELASSRYARAKAYESVRGGLAARPSRHLFVWGSFVLDQQKAADPAYTGKKWRGLAGDVEQAFVCYQNGGFNLQAGRFSSFWGNRNSLLLGPNTIMDGVAYSFRWGRLALSYRLSKLDGLSPERDGVVTFENRYLAGHRIDVHLSDRLRIGVSELVLFGGPGRQLEFAYLNPILFYHGFQVNDNADDNTVFGIDFEYRPFNRLLLQCQLLVDDFQIEKKAQSDQEPDEYGIVAGVYVADIAKEWDLKAEYTRVTNRTYNQPIARNRYLFDGRPIGAVPGNDFDQLTLSVIRWMGRTFRASLNGALLRQGEGTPTDEWSTPWLDVTGDYSEPFPTGVVEKRSTISAGLDGVIRGALFFNMTAGVERTSNVDHRHDLDRTSSFIRIGLSVFLSGTVDTR